MSPADYREQQLPDQVTMGLLQYLNAHTLDEDYALAAERRTAGGGGTPRRGGGIVAALVLAGFGVLAVTAGAQTSANGTNDAAERRELIAQVNARQDEVAADRRQIRDLQAETERLESLWFAGGGPGAEVLARQELLALRNGTIAAAGPGVRVRVDDAADAGDDDRRKVLDTDLQHLANGLWEAGAEAIAINGERLSNLSAIRHAGSAITVNFRPISPPYRVEAIGDPDRIPAQFGETTSGQTWLDLQREIGLQFSMRRVDELVLPAAPERDLRWAQPLREKDPKKDEVLP